MTKLRKSVGYNVLNFCRTGKASETEFWYEFTVI